MWLKKQALYGSYMSLFRLYGNMLLISEKNVKHKAQENKGNSPDMESALWAAWFGLLLLFTVSLKFSYHQLNLTLSIFGMTLVEWGMQDV